MQINKYSGTKQSAITVRKTFQVDWEQKAKQIILQKLQNGYV